MASIEKIENGDGKHPEVASTDQKLDFEVSDDRARLEAMGYKEVLPSPPSDALMNRNSSDLSHFSRCLDCVLRF